MVDFMMINNSLLSMLSWDDIYQAMMVNGGFYDD